MGLDTLEPASIKSLGAFVFVHMLPTRGVPGSFGLGGQTNECGSVSVRGEAFSLAAAQGSPVIASAGDDGVSFRPYRTIARFSETERPRFWVVPLLNFVADFTVIDLSLHDHPLRARATERLDTRETGPLRPYHESFYSRGNALIPFICGGAPAFVEPLADYADRRSRVEAVEQVVTAVAVGQVSDGLDIDAGNWFPAELLLLLGLSSGRALGAPFVELRGETGELVARMHARMDDAGVSRGRGLIDEPMNRSTGKLLTAFAASDVQGTVWFRVMLRHLLRALTAGGSIEDRLSSLFRVIDAASAGLGLNCGRPLEVEDKVRREINKAIADLIVEIGEISGEATELDRQRLAQLQNRLGEITSNRPSFPTQLLELVESAQLPDAAWLRGFEFRHKTPSADGEPKAPVLWSKAAGQYRNRIVHSGFLDIEVFDVDNAIAFIGHLSDVLARVVFHLIDFHGEYTPPCGYRGMAIYETPDWADAERLSADAFGYIE
jgi:hypothetical protein